MRLFKIIGDFFKALAPEERSLEELQKKSRFWRGHRPHSSGSARSKLRRRAREILGN